MTTVEARGTGSAALQQYQDQLRNYYHLYIQKQTVKRLQEIGEHGYMKSLASTDTKQLTAELIELGEQAETGGWHVVQGRYLISPYVIAIGRSTKVVLAFDKSGISEKKRFLAAKLFEPKGDTCKGFDREVGLYSQLDDAGSDTERAMFVPFQDNPRPTHAEWGITDTCTHPPHILLLELCDQTLEDWMHRNADRQIAPITLDGILQKVCNSVHALHSLGLKEISTGQRVVKAHTNITPRKFLMNMDGTSTRLADFELVYELKKLRDSSTYTTARVGTTGWQSPEQVEGRRNPGLQSDVYQVGLVMYYVLVDQKFRIEAHHELEKLLTIPEYSGWLGTKPGEVSCRGVLAFHLIGAMLQHKEASRPSMEQVLKHPFWYTKPMMDKIEHNEDPGVFRTVLKRLKNEESKFETDVIRFQKTVMNDERWKFEPVFYKCAVSNGGKNYTNNQVRELLRFVRNTCEHWEEKCTSQEHAALIKDYPHLKGWVDALRFMLHAYPGLVEGVVFLAMKMGVKGTESLRNCSSFKLRPREILCGLTESNHDGLPGDSHLKLSHYCTKGLLRIQKLRFEDIQGRKGPQFLLTQRPNTGVVVTESMIRAEFGAYGNIDYIKLHVDKDGCSVFIIFRGKIDKQPTHRHFAVEGRNAPPYFVLNSFNYVENKPTAGGKKNGQR